MTEQNPTEGPTEPQKPYRYRLERGWAKRQLIHELARMEKTQQLLAQEYGVTESAVTQFKQRHQAEIEAVKLDIENEFAGLWVARKVNRLAELESDIERIISTNAGDTVRMADAEILRTKAALLKQVADELGQIPNKSHIRIEQDTVVRYLMTGVDDTDLK
jgi:predicted transcriptional regulator